MGKNVKRIAIGAAIAGAAGYVAGLMTAPKSGKETRQDVMKAAGDGVNEVEKQLKNIHGELENLLDDARVRSDDLNVKAQQELRDLMDKAKTSAEKVKDMLRAVRQGKAEDKDLKKAIDDAKHAAKHIKDYLQK
jgi:gas vesicle protein